MKQNPDKQFAELKKRKFGFQFLITLVLAQFVVASDALCQLMTNNGAGITITSGVQVTVRGDIQNNAGTAIDNNGTIDLSGNWTHNAANNCFGTSAGTVIFNGASQNIGGTNATTFNNLQLAGTGTKTLLQNISTGGGYASPSGILDLTSRILDLNSNLITITNSSTNAIAFTTGYLLSEDVDNSSKVTWRINAVTGVHTIPFGNASAVPIPFSFNLTSGNAGDVTVSTYASSPNNTPYPVTPVLVTHVRNNFNTDNSANTVDRFWEVDPTGNPVASLTFTYASAENAAAGNTNVRGQKWNLTYEAWEAPLTGQINPTSQSVFVPNVTSFGPWALAIEANPLPIELLSFKAKPVDNKEVLCTWSTASEINNDFFTVERSQDGKNFENVGSVEGAGNSTAVLNYRFADKNPYTGLSYYRLQQTDFNGSFSYSPVEAVYIAKENSDIFVYPNPCNGIFYVINTSPGIPVDLSLFDMKGKLLLKKYVNEASNRIDISHMPKAVYNLHAVFQGANKVFRIVVQ